MKKLFLIPIMALLVILGMSFTSFGSEFEEHTEVVASDYIRVNGNWQPISEQDCNSGSNDCKVKFSENGQEFKVYDEMDLSTLRKSPTPGAKLINP
ncbi:DUF6520 family protein [Christiangramia echinicola]|uniref:Uncharacterized protein n=1 Tax=Christiangramia echinicola TaxID=279359 RepID=A0A1H1SC55_9FLAO|nr:DUF6520 family protein [Christiangramia echinicola]SDS44929.1 hypothetical protein SAMN04488552_3196 [Christiangramia echinicola]